MKITVKKVPHVYWMTDAAKKVVDDFNNSGEKLTIDLWNEYSTTEELEVALECGEYNILYPDCPEAKILEEVYEEASCQCCFINLEVSDLDI